MGGLRTLLFGHRRLTALAVALALAVKLLLPAGFMLDSSAQGSITVAICADASGDGHARTVSIPLKTDPGQADPGKSSAAKAQGTCPWAGHGMNALGGADLALLALALGFIVAMGFLPAPPLLIARRNHLRPPLRGPPLLA